MATAARDRDRLIGMQPARRCDDHRIGGRRREHRIERRVPGRPGLAHCSLKRYRIDVAHVSYLGIVGMGYDGPKLILLDTANADQTESHLTSSPSRCTGQRTQAF